MPKNSIGINFNTLIYCAFENFSVLAYREMVCFEQRGSECETQRAGV